MKKLFLVLFIVVSTNFLHAGVWKEACTKPCTKQDNMCSGDSPGTAATCCCDGTLKDNSAGTSPSNTPGKRYTY